MRNKALILFTILLLGITFLVVRHQYSSKRTIIGTEAPEIEVTDIHKNRVKLSELKGSLVVINFWASWCSSCVDEIPSIEGLFKNLSGNPQFRLITILYRDDGDRVSRSMKEKGYTFPIYSDPVGAAAKSFGITGVPETFFIDKKGILRNKVIGPLQWDSPRVIASLQSLMNE
ncbi:MAG: TlpA disulfide reductase family protein [Thermodesulfovibrionales bacterium]|nr:TlpA disulfide reductase family protein [Thermodesulfovibrionales bacterium]